MNSIRTEWADFSTLFKIFVPNPLTRNLLFYGRLLLLRPERHHNHLRSVRTLHHTVRSFRLPLLSTSTEDRDSGGAVQWKSYLAFMENLMEMEEPVEDDLRPEYDLSKLIRLPAAKLHFRRRAKQEPLELTSAFPGFDEGPPPGYEWDPNKAESNYRKHAVTFNEAYTVFNNPRAEETFDPGHSQEEDRYLLIGHSARGRVLIISYTDREEGTRIISARKAEPHERRDYENGAIS